MKKKKDYFDKLVTKLKELNVLFVPLLRRSDSLKENATGLDNQVNSFCEKIDGIKNQYQQETDFLKKMLNDSWFELIQLASNPDEGKADLDAALDLLDGSFLPYSSCMTEIVAVLKEKSDFDLKKKKMGQLEGQILGQMSSYDGDEQEKEKLSRLKKGVSSLFKKAYLDEDKTLQKKAKRLYKKITSKDFKIRGLKKNLNSIQEAFNLTDNALIIRENFCDDLDFALTNYTKNKTFHQEREKAVYDSQPKLNRKEILLAAFEEAYHHKNHLMIKGQKGFLGISYNVLQDIYKDNQYRDSIMDSLIAVSDDLESAMKNELFKPIRASKLFEIKPKVEQRSASWPRLYLTKGDFVIDQNSVKYADSSLTEQSKEIFVVFVKGTAGTQTKGSQISNEALYHYLRANKQKNWELCDLSEGKEVKKKSPVKPVLVSSVNGGR